MLSKEEDDDSDGRIRNGELQIPYDGGMDGCDRDVEVSTEQGESVRYVGCRHCGLVHELPGLGLGERAYCVRCRGVMGHDDGNDQRAGIVQSRVMAITLTALMLYPAAILMPIMSIQRFGFESEASVWTGMVGLFADGHWFIAGVIFAFSIVAPIGKLGLLLMVCLGRGMMGNRDRALAFRIVEKLGRWGMVDVMLVAILVAVVKLGDVVTVTPGAGMVVFGTVVLLGMVASGLFEPWMIWVEDDE